ncbi:MAG: imelysin family protein [Bacteroidota bacterium]|nr:imelysin family protein [Bacteroidota bacterium]
MQVHFPALYIMINAGKHKLLFIAVLLILGCGGKENEPSPGDDTKDRKVILTHWADNVIVPSYESFHEKLYAMTVAADAFIASPDESTLPVLRSAWEDAYLEWQNVELFEFGPADKYTLRNFFNIYPTDVAGIVSNMNDPSVNLALPATYTRQGFPALDYLINGVAGDDAGIVDYYTTGEESGKRIAYLERITTRMASLLQSVIDEWGGPYREKFINDTGLDIGSSMGVVVNGYVLYYERYIRSGKIGIPSGAAIGSAGVPYPEKIEALFRRDISLALAKNAHHAAEGFFNGKDVTTGLEGPSFKSYLDALEAKDATSNTLLSDIINSQFETINAELDELSPDLYQQIETDNGKMADTYAAMQKLVRMLKVDMTSAMSVTITYTDNDGD